MTLTPAQIYEVGELVAQANELMELNAMVLTRREESQLRALKAVDIDDLRALRKIRDLRQRAKQAVAAQPNPVQPLASFASDMMRIYEKLRAVGVTEERARVVACRNAAERRAAATASVRR